ALTPAPLDTQAIYQLMQAFNLPVSTLNPVMNARYLHGYIDLVYEHQGKYYVADYKSNSLKIAGQPDCFDNYQPAAMQTNMSEAGYWLQAVLYQVALHRYLQVRLPNYQPAQHLGGVVYLYLRGLRE
ncbi:PD-(D/E)XK nuclease family protein, partial [Rhizobium hidalgonense]